MLGLKSINFTAQLTTRKQQTNFDSIFSPFLGNVAKGPMPALLSVYNFLRQHLRHGHGHGHGATSDSEACEDTLSFHGRLSPRVSLSVATDDEMTPTTKHKSGKFNLGKQIV
jgi:hypothetical protein